MTQSQGSRDLGVCQGRVALAQENWDVAFQVDGWWSHWNRPVVFCSGSELNSPLSHAIPYVWGIYSIVFSITIIVNSFSLLLVFFFLIIFTHFQAIISCYFDDYVLLWQKTKMNCSGKIKDQSKTNRQSRTNRRSIAKTLNFSSFLAQASQKKVNVAFHL